MTERKNEGKRTNACELSCVFCDARRAGSPGGGDDRRRRRPTILIHRVLRLDLLSCGSVEATSARTLNPTQSKPRAGENPAKAFFAFGKSGPSQERQANNPGCTGTACCFVGLVVELAVARHNTAMTADFFFCNLVAAGERPEANLPHSLSNPPQSSSPSYTRHFVMTFLFPLAQTHAFILIAIRRPGPGKKHE